jgi:hypothetical protein
MALSRNHAQMAGITRIRALTRSCAVYLFLMPFGSPFIIPGVTVAPQTDKPAPARTVVDLSPDELTKTYPELKNVGFAPTQDDLALLLDKAGNRVEELFRDLPNTSSRERIRMEMLNQNGGTVRSLTRDFQYLLVAQSTQTQPERAGANSVALLKPETGKVKIEEYRTDSKGSEIDVLKLTDAFVLTGGYVSVPLYFHPYYRDGSVFRYLGREATAGGLHVIAFAQLPERTRLGGSFQFLAGPVVFFIQGFAWIDPTTYQIVRMRTDLLRPLPEAGLMEQTTKIELADVRFSENGRTFRLPQEVVVNTRSMGYNFRNRHQYSQYRLFTVDAKEAGRQIVVPSKPPE